MILEHWFEFFKGEAPFADLRAFWPAVGTLGYTDMLLVPGVVYSLIRFMGVDLFIAPNMTFIIIHFAGIIVLYKTFRKLGCSQLISFIGLFFSLWSCSFTQLSYHTQFFCMGIVPIFLWAVIHLYRNIHGRFSERLPWAVVATCSVGLSFLSAYYPAYFMVIVALVAALVFCVIGGKKRIKLILGYIRENIRELLLYSFFQIFWIIPFLYIYLPVLGQSGGYNYASSWVYAPELYDILRTRSNAPIEDALASVLPSFLPEGVISLLANRIMETSYGWPVLTFVLFSVMMIILLFRKKEDIEEQAVFSLGLSILMIFCITCRYGEFLPWFYIGKILPGASSIRSLGRYMGICTPFLAIFLCLNIKKFICVTVKKIETLKKICLVILGAIILFVNQSPRYARGDISELKDRLQQVSQPPQECKVFFICPGNVESYSIYEENMFAWLIADRFNCYTLNGYSGNKPLNWELWEQDLRDYYTGIQNWIAINHLEDYEGIYGYISNENIWVPYSELNIIIGDS